MSNMLKETAGMKREDIQEPVIQDKSGTNI